MVTQYYKGYLDKVESCLGINTNPKLREDIIGYLDRILSDFREIEYDWKHYETMYEKFLNTVITQAQAGDYDGLVKSYSNIFNSEYQKKLTEFDEKMNILLNIHEYNTYENIKKTASELYGWVYNATDLPLEAIDSYKEKIEIFDSCLDKIGEFMNKTVPYNVEYFSAYINDIIYDLASYACEMRLDKVGKIINDANDSIIQEGLEDLSTVLNKLKVIKEGSDDYHFNGKIEDLFEKIRNELYLSSGGKIEVFVGEALDLIDEYRYG